MLGRGWQAPGLLLRLVASRPGLQDGRPVCRAVCQLRLMCLSSLHAPRRWEMVWRFSPRVGIWSWVSDPRKLHCSALEWVSLMGNRSGIPVSPHPTPHCWPLGAPSWSPPPSYLSSQTGGQGHGRLWFLCGLLSRIRFPDARHCPSSRPLRGEVGGGAPEMGVPWVWS